MPSTIVDGEHVRLGRELRLADVIGEQGAPREGACGKRPCASSRRFGAHAMLGRAPEAVDGLGFFQVRQ